MEGKLLKIINHFGVDNQQRKLEEEVFEVNKAITLYSVGKDNKEHLEEEIGDVLNVIDEFIYYYDLDVVKIFDSRVFKIDRTLKENNING